MKWTEHVGKKRNEYKDLLGTPEEKRTIGRPRP
jgi:hypothetical protein